MQQSTRYQNFKRTLEARLSRSGMSVYDIYDIINHAHPRDCDENEPCVHRGHHYQNGEWRHIVRNVLQGLKKEGVVIYDLKNRLWLRK